MSEGPPPDEQIPADDIDCGKPVAELAALREMPSSGFIDRISRSVGRRRLAAEATQVTAQLPVLLLLEFIALLFQALTGKITRHGGPDHE